MSRIFCFLALRLLFFIPLPGFILFSNVALALELPGQIKGKVIDAGTKSCIEFANVSLIQLKDSLPIQVTATNPKGEFSLANIKPGRYAIYVHFIGFKDFKSSPIILAENSATYKLEPISLEIESINLDEVAVTSNPNRPVYQLEKKTIYTGNQVSAAGGTASDLLHHLPAVTQAPDGSISIHGNSNLLVYIDGKPSALRGDELLQNMPASEVKKIELITSPSAKYDASGSGGIINLITKKSNLDGLNGNIQASSDHLGGYSSDLLLNYKYKKFSFFAGLDHNRRRNRGDMDYLTQFLSTGSDFSKTGLQKAQRINTGIRSGFDYLPSNTDKFSFVGSTGNFETNNNGSWLTNGLPDFTYLPSGTSGNVTTDDNKRKGKYGGADVTYEHKFKTENKLLTLSASWNTLNYDDNYVNKTDISDIELLKQTTLLSKINNNFQFNTDYSTPAGKAGNLEFGYQLTSSDEAESYQSQLVPLLQPETWQHTRFNSLTQAGYGTWQYKSGRINMKAGLRAENLNRVLRTLDHSYSLHRFDLYPSFNSSFRIDSTREIQFNYSRRTDQLKTIQLDPLPRWYDFYNMIMGNPDLKNEITDRLSIDYLVNFRKLNFSGELFFYNTAGKIEVIRSLYRNGIVRNQYENTGSERTLGAELNANWPATSWLRLNEKLDVIGSSLDVRLDSLSQNKSYRQLYGVTSADIILAKDTRIELDLSYFGPAMTAQSSVDQFFMAGISLRKTFFNKRLTCTITGRDVLGVYKRIEHVQGTDFNQTINARNNFPIRFSVSYKFNSFNRDDRRAAKTPVIE
ncbi:MAG: TonB-dependent receptor [Prolixibacteraceae bacterium]